MIVQSVTNFVNLTIECSESPGGIFKTDTVMVTPLHKNNIIMMRKFTGLLVFHLFYMFCRVFFSKELCALWG